MKWKKLGLVFNPNNFSNWAFSHAMIPTPLRISEEIVRVYITFCDVKGIGRTGYVDLSAGNLKDVVGYSKNPVLDIGKNGTFDENGVLACSVIDAGHGKHHMYYVGFECGHKIRYRLLTGLALSGDGGITFERYSTVPVLERSSKELYFRGGPCCLKERDKFRMWYVAGSSWTEINGKSMPEYNICYIESEDGLNWPSFGEIQIHVTDPDEHGFGRPFVIRSKSGKYKMFYSVRKRSVCSYRLGYAESRDGRNWKRMDDQLNLDISEKGFDSDAIMYATPIEVRGKMYVFYNGNDFGKDGFAIAELIEE